jgi:hypothetical protein
MAAWMDERTLEAVRPAVRSVLEQAKGFQDLAPEKKREIASAMVKVAAYMANPDGLAREELSAPDGGILAKNTSAQEPLAREFKGVDPVEQTKQNLSKDPGFAGKDFEAGAVKQGVQQFREMVQAVDFPMFVSGLIQNVFQAIVDSSIRQMEAYGTLLKSVAQTVDQFAQDNITENNARDWLSQRFPDMIDIETPEMPNAPTGFAEETEPQPQAKVVVKAEDEQAALKTISEELELAKPLTDISDEDQERTLVRAARLQIARSRQQLLASMVMLGINRIVVTDGLIHAKVVFDMRAMDTAERRYRASMLDKRKETSGSAFAGGFGGWFGGGAYSKSEHMTTVSSSVDNRSQSQAEVKAKLTGEVRVNFKSDYFPMEKLANPQMIAAIQGNAIPPEKKVPAGA